MGGILTAAAHPHGAAVPRARSRVYLCLALAMSTTVFWGFAYTYFTPVLSGAYPAVSPAIHIHGWSFFLWFLLLPLQTLLLVRGRWKAHVAMGAASVALAAVMVFTGALIASVRIDQGLSSAGGDVFTRFWKDFGQLIMYNMVLFIAFYGTAIALRRQPGIHKRLMVLASASILPAAIFRIIVGVSGFDWLATPAWVMPTAFFLPAVFVVLGMISDRVLHGRIHRVYLVGLPLLLALHAFGLAVAGTAVGDAISRAMAGFAHVFGALY